MRRALRKRRVFDFVPSYLKINSSADIVTLSGFQKLSRRSPSVTSTYSQMTLSLAFVSSPTASALQAKLQPAADVISCWFSEWHLTVNTTKTVSMVIRSQNMPPCTLSIRINDKPVEQRDTHRHLGVTFSSTLRWAEHIDCIIYNASRKLGVLRRLRRTLTPAVLLFIWSTPPSSQQKGYYKGWERDRKRMGKNRGIGWNIFIVLHLCSGMRKKNIKNACAHCYWSKKFETSRAEGRSLLAVAATNLFQVVAAWKSGERWKKDLFGRWTRIERGLVRGDCLRLPGDIHGERALDIYTTCIRPTLEYANLVWCGLSKSDCARLERCQRSAARIITGISPLADVSRDLLLARAGLCTLEARRNASLAFFVNRLLTDRLPQHLRNVTNAWLSSPPNLRRSVRRASFILALPKPKKECLRRSPLYMSFCLWNKVMVDLRWSKKELPTR